MCEAYVTLGRLSHVKARHGETTAFMAQSLVDAGVDSAVEAAMAKVRGEVSTAYRSRLVNGLRLIVAGSPFSLALPSPFRLGSVFRAFVAFLPVPLLLSAGKHRRVHVGRSCQRPTLTV